MAEQTTSVKIGPVRVSYAHIWKPQKAPGSDTLKYSIKLLLHKKKDAALIEEIKKAIQTAYKLKKDELFKGKAPKDISGFRYPLRDGDTEDAGEEAKGHYFVNCNSESAPEIVDKRCKPILDQSAVYSGCYCYVSVNFFAFNKGGGKGIAAGLGNVMKVKDGERLSGKPSAASDFADIEVDDDDEDFIKDSNEEDGEGLW